MGPTIFTHAASLSATKVRAISAACSSLSQVTKITLILCGVLAGISANLTREAFAQFGGSASIFERLAIVHEQNRHLDSEAGLEVRVAVDLDALYTCIEFRRLGGNHG